MNSARPGRRRITILILVALLALNACATLPPQGKEARPLAYTAPETAQLLGRWQPVIAIENQEEVNRLGTPRARIQDSGAAEIWIDPDTPTVFSELRKFQTAQGEYTNLLYRLHFQRVPFRLAPFHLTAGPNGGLLIIVTLDPRGLPILYTTVHTCGCYLAFIPTSNLPASAYPEDWRPGRQESYGENLPARLDFPDSPLDETHLLILLRPETHRVMDLRLTTAADLTGYDTVTAADQPLATLETLALPDHATTSFYEERGPRIGYVKGSCKPWERLLMSWWTFDWHIGEDKRLGHNREEPPLFYTSLKPWARAASDLRDFPAFLNYWGWKL